MGSVEDKERTVTTLPKDFLKKIKKGLAFLLRV
jgi:hypothetical protein